MNRKNKFFQKHVLNTKNKPDHEIVSALFETVFGFTRMRKQLKHNVESILLHMIRAQRHLNYKYYLQKNCPLPEDWKNKKKQYLEIAQKADPEQRGKVYKELFD